MKEIQFQLHGKAVTGQLGSRVEKKSLYGFSRYVAEKDGVLLQKGYLDPDGRLLQRGDMTLLKMDPDGTPVAEVITEIDGAVAEPVASSFDRAAEVTPIPLAELAGFNVTDVYPLEGLTLDAGLYRTEFNYRKSVQPKESLLLVKTGEAWLLSGVRRTPTFVGLSVAYSFFDQDDAADGDDEELDFSMV